MRAANVANFLGGRRLRSSVGRGPSRRVALAATGAVVCALAVHAGDADSRGPTLVVDNSFVMKTSDPQRAYDPTAAIVDRAIYDTLFTYRSRGLADPVPLLVRSWTTGEGAKKFTF